jgi:hypothetical protein
MLEYGSGMTETMYHGNGDELALHEGLCLTDDARIAAEYAYGDGGVVHTIEVDLTGLAVCEVEGYDRSENSAPGDDLTQWDADVIVYTDETINGRPHRTWRLMSAAALAAVRHVATTDAEEI